MTDGDERSINRITSALSIDRNPGVILTDPARKGLRLVPVGNRRRVWKYRYRASDGRLRQLQLGEYPTMSWKRAGQEWQKHKVERDAPSGGDPVAVIREASGGEGPAFSRESRCMLHTRSKNYALTTFDTWQQAATGAGQARL